MRTKCAWCGKLLNRGKKGERLSHGICESCAINEFEVLGIDPNIYLAALPKAAGARE